MAAYSLESLVLRGVSVRCDGQAVELCRDANEAAAIQLPGVHLSMQHPWPGYPQVYSFTPAARLNRGKCDWSGTAARSRSAPGLCLGRVLPSDL